VSDEGLVIVSQSHAATIPWPAISEISLGGANWVIFSQTMAYYLPRRLFADTAAEGAFITACRAHLSVAAQARSIGP
jgi:hypothetical protein